MATKQYKFIGKHVEDLQDGRPLVPGETIAIAEGDKTVPHNQRYFDEGLLIEALPTNPDRGKREGGS